MLPSVQITKVDGQTGVVRPSATGVCAIIATSEKGTKNLPSSFARDSLALAEFGDGRLVEFAAYMLPTSGKPVVLVRSDDSTAGAYGSITQTGTGTSDATAGATEPFDDFSVFVVVTTGGTIGVSGIKYKWSLDGGKTYSKITALGTDDSILIPRSNVTIELSAGTLVAGDAVSFTTTAPHPTTTDLTDALEALRVTALPWDTVLIDAAADSTIISQVNTWLASMNTAGRFKTAVLTSRRRAASGETEAQYLTAMQTAFDASTSTDIVVCADLADLASPVRGISLPRPVGLFVAARGMKNAIGRDVAYVADGAVPGAIIVDDRNNPKYHDEGKYPGLDDLRLATLRTFDGRPGAYITNAPILSSVGSDYVYWQHARVINRGCEIAFETLTTQLSVGVDKDPKPGPGGARYIAEKDAQRIEELVNAQFDRELVATGQVADMKFQLSRTDDISSNAGAVLTGAVQSVALGYVKKFAVTAGFVKQIGG